MLAEKETVARQHAGTVIGGVIDSVLGSCGQETPERLDRNLLPSGFVGLRVRGQRDHSHTRHQNRHKSLPKPFCAPFGFAFRTPDWVFDGANAPAVPYR